MKERDRFNLYRDWELLKVGMIPDGKSGDFEVSTFEVSKADSDFTSLRAMITGGRDRTVPAGSYKKLVRKGGAFETLVFSDTEAEIKDQAELIRNRRGRILIHGLGLGVAARACLMSSEVSSVTVVEISTDVIKLVAPTLRKEDEKFSSMFGVEPRLKIVTGDALTWKPPRGARYEFAWHDIWDHICADNLEPMRKLHQRFRHRVQRQESWSRDQLRYLRRRGW